MKHVCCLLIFLSIESYSLLAQQTPDLSYNPKIGAKMYPDGDGPIIYMDKAHKNFHTRDGRYTAFTRVLEADGYRVADFDQAFSSEALKNVKILVIANALGEESHPVVKPTKSAFTDEEVQSIKKWVAEGGALFLIADHMPFAGAAANLAQAFDFEFYDGFAMYNPKKGKIDYTLEDKNLASHAITQGRNQAEQVTRVRSFTGQGFKIPEGAESILKLDSNQKIYLTEAMWEFNEDTEQFPATDLSQGAIMKYKKGRLVMFGEAAMFSAQLAFKKKMKVGMNAKGAEQNYQLLLNLVHWLDGKLD